MPEPNQLHDFSNLPDDLYMVLGRLTARYGLFEYQLALTIKRFSNDFQEWDEIWEWMGGFGRSRLQVETIKVFQVRTTNERQRNELRKVIEEADALAKKRHDAVHCGWSIDQNGNVGATRKGYAPLDMTIDDLNELADNFHRLAATIAKFSPMGLVTENDGRMTVYSSAATFRP